jgi:hypothetical protein
MKLELLLFLMIAAGSVGTACGASASSSGAGAGPGGFGGSGESTSTGDSATAAQTGSAQSGTGSSGTGAVGGAGGGFPTDCAATATCGNFGAGCIKCAAKTACATEYQACFDDAPCKAYSACIEPCGAKQLDCLQLCANQYPGGATKHQTLIHCVICGDCSTLCEHSPDTCK